MTYKALRFPQLLLIFVFLNLLGAQILHEAGHWAVLQLYGRRPLWGFSSIVQLWDQAPRSPDEWSVFIDPIDGEQGWLHLGSSPESDTEMLVFILAGPVTQVLAVGAGLLLFHLGKNEPVKAWGLLLAGVNAFGQVFYQFISLARGSGGDETLIGFYLGLSPSVVHLAFGLVQLAGLLYCFKLLETRRRRLAWGGALFLGTLPVGPLIMLANRMVIEEVDAGSPFFRGILGFSTPVFLTGLVSFFCLRLLAARFDSGPPVKRG